MKNLILCGVLFCTMSVAGCCGKCGGVKEEQTQQRAERFPPSTELPVDVPVSTTNIELVGISYTKGGARRTFQSLIGPNGAVPARYFFHHSDSTINLQDGWAYMSGDQPMGDAEPVCASTPGTTIILQVLNGSDPATRVSRVILVERKGHDYVDVYDKSDPNYKIQHVHTSALEGLDRYVEKVGNGPLSKNQPVRNSPEVSALVDMVKREAIRAGILQAGRGVKP